MRSIMEYAKTFLLSGSIVTLSKVAANHANMPLSAVLGGIPLGLLAVFFITGRDDKRQYIKGYAYVSFLVFLSAVSLGQILELFPSAPVNGATLGAMAVWFVVSLLVATIFASPD